MNALQVATILLVIACASAQYRPGYAPNGVQYPRPISPSEGEGVGTANRFGGGDTVTERIDRQDIYGHDKKLIQDTANLPRDRLPFWFINRQQILKHIGLNPSVAAGAPQPSQVEPEVDPFQPIGSTVPSGDSSSNFA